MLPKLTHVQAYVIQLIASGERSGRFIRSSLADIGEAKSDPAFYQFMSRLEKAGMVAGIYRVTVTNGQTIKERKYHATIKGMSEFLRTADFYNSAKERSHIPKSLELALLASDQD